MTACYQRTASHLLIIFISIKYIATLLQYEYTLIAFNHNFFSIQSYFISLQKQ